MKKIISKLLSLFLAVTMCFSVTSVFAASIGSVSSDTSIGEDTVQSAQTEYGEVGEGSTNTDVYLTIDNNNIVVGVPTEIILSGTPNDYGEYIGNYSVEVYGDITGSQKLCVAPKDKDIEITQTGKNPQKATIIQEQIAFNSADLNNGTTTTGVVMAEGLTAGSWYANTTFSIVLTDFSQTPVIPDETSATYIYVTPDGDNETADGTIEHPYSSVWYANQSITDNSADNKYVIKVADGEYNDLETIYNSSTPTTQYWGIIAKDNVYYLGNPEHPENVVINWDAANSITDTDELVEKVSKTEIFHIFGETETAIKGMTLNATNTLRTLHIEQTGTGNIRGTQYLIEDCNIIHNGYTTIPNQYTDVIGCGSNDGEYGLFKNCNITQYGYAKPTRLYSVHSNTANSTGLEGAKIIFENCTFNAPNVSGDNKPRISTDGISGQNSDKPADIYVINCIGTNADGECGIYYKETPNEYNIYSWCSSAPSNMANITYFNDFSNKTYEIIQYNSQDAIGVTHLYVKPNAEYKIQVNDGYVIQCVRSYKPYANGLELQGQSNYANAQRVTYSTSVNQYGDTATSLVVIVKRSDNSAITQEDLSNVVLRIEQI